MACCGRGQVQQSCSSLNPNGRSFGTVRNGGIGGYDPCPGLPSCRPTFRVPQCPMQQPSNGPTQCIPIGYPSPKPCGQNPWPRPGQCGSAQGQEFQLNFNCGGSTGRIPCPAQRPKSNCPSICGCGGKPYPFKNDCEIRSPCPRPPIPYSDGCSPAPCRPCCAPPCCNPLPPCCLKIQPCLPKCCPSLSCRKPPYCCPNPCIPQPDTRCCPKPMILCMNCPPQSTLCCTKKPCSCGF